MDRVNPIIIHDKEKGVDYTLEFNRESVRFAEGKGFVIGNIDEYPLSKTEDLFYYAFRMHHRNVPREKTDKLLQAMGGLPTEALERLGELYLAPIKTVLKLDDETEEETKNMAVVVELL